jgi:hypothetical protein
MYSSGATTLPVCPTYTPPNTSDTQTISLRSPKTTHLQRIIHIASINRRPTCTHRRTQHIRKRVNHPLERFRILQRPPTRNDSTRNRQVRPVRFRDLGLDVLRPLDGRRIVQLGSLDPWT